MSVIIKGMKMPENCFDCPCCNGENGYCQLRKEYVYGEVPRSCPIIPIPEHGRPIDGDVLFDFILNIYKTAKGDARKAYSYVLDTIAAAGDIIPAEDGEA